MEILKPLSPTNPQIFSSSSPFSVSNPIKIYRNKNPSHFHTPFFNFPFKSSPLFLNFPIHSSRSNSRVSAHFRRPTKRRKNHLREKLVEQQVRQNPTSPLQHPVRELNDSPSNSEDFNVPKSKNLKNPLQESDDFGYSVSNLDGDVSKSKNTLWNQLESWVDHYKADAEFWGIGSSPIFTVFQDSNGKVEKVDVNEDEIIKRSHIEPSIYKLKGLEDVKEVREKISHAKFLARQMEIGNNVIPRNSSIAKFINSRGKSGLGETILDFSRAPGIVPRLSNIGISVFCGVLVFLALKTVFAGGKGEEDKEECSSFEKEMLRRKIKSRMAKEKSIKGSVEVIQDPKEPEIVFIERPRVDKDKLMNSIVEVKAASDNSVDFDVKIQEIRAMARHAREIEKTGALDNNRSNEEENGDVSNVSNEKGNIGISDVVDLDVPNVSDVSQGDESRILGGSARQEKGNIGISEVPELEIPGDGTRTLSGSNRVEKGGIGFSDVSEVEVANDDENVTKVVENSSSKLLDTEELNEKKSLRRKPRIIKSVKEAKEYLSKKKPGKQEKTQEVKPANVQEVAMNPNMAENRESFHSDNSVQSTKKSTKDTTMEEKGNALNRNTNSEDEKQECIKDGDAKVGELGRVDREKWVEDNFHEFEPIVEKIRDGFRNNYMVAREKVKEDVNVVSELKQLVSAEDGSEFEWMKDEKLREIVFQVRENELMGRDPFYLLDAEDKALFFKGLEKNVERVNEKLNDLHEYLHSNIENLDYGADGISVYDPPEKVIPRWKGPPPPTTMSPQFLDDFLEQRKALFAETFGDSNLVKTESKNPLQNANEKVENGSLKTPKTVIEGSDGSIRPGKKSGKEFWQHTKKWSRGFLDSYNAENDPEMKAVMKDIGKDLDRWITEKEIQESADMMDNVSVKGKKLIAEKINKVKREMELFGPQAVVSKYSEYGDDKEVDYYWWLDLPFVLCIELYIGGDGEQRIGFYSLEMAADLEIDPKPHHIIAFEDAGDCKNLCYIIQAHLEMLGNGNAFVVPQLPKDTYREARATGFNVTVIRKGELQLNVDQTLEEVEEQITEIGSKMYHDKIMKGRNVDMGSIMKGVLGLNKSSKRRRSRKKLKKSTK